MLSINMARRQSSFAQARVISTLGIAGTASRAKFGHLLKSPLMLLGAGFVVAPPSRGTKSNYQFIEGSLDDLDSLPVLRGINIETPPLSPASMPDEVVTKGRRNKMLWEHCMRSARQCDDFGALLDVGQTRNQAFVPPLPDDEVFDVATSAWCYTERGLNRFGQHGVYFCTEEANRLITSNSDAFVLLAFLRANNGPGSTFIVANGLADTLGWGLNRLRSARNRLQETEIEMVRRPSTYQGPALYRWRSQSDRSFGGEGKKGKKKGEVLVEDSWSNLTTLGAGQEPTEPSPNQVTASDNLQRSCCWALVAATMID